MIVSCVSGLVFVKIISRCMRTLEVFSLLLTSADLCLPLLILIKFILISDSSFQVIPVRARVFFWFLLQRFRPGPRSPAGDLPLVHMNGGGGGPGGQGGSGAVLQDLPLPSGADEDDLSDGHLGLDPDSGPKVIYLLVPSGNVVYCATQLVRYELYLF